MRFEDMASRDDIGLVLNDMGLTGIGAEVGVAFGENAEQILMKSNLKTLLLIDPWDYVPDQSSVGYGDMIKDWNGCYEYCLNKLAPMKDRTSILKMSSLDASCIIADGSLDFVYIDANHMSPFVDQDLEQWYPKVRSGGVFGGHDYHDYQNEVYTCNVKAAVDNFLSSFQSIHDLHIVPGEVPSWFVVKP